MKERVNQTTMIKRVKECRAKLIVGTLIILIGIFSVIRHYYNKSLWAKNGRVVEGQIVDAYKHPMGKNWIYRCCYVYDYGGQHFSHIQNFSSEREITRYRLGECVQVIISKENPKISRIYSESSYKCDN